ncbi:MAG: HIRAN domain-containing protein [Paludibacteraceae bacterium]|nr:HIRAN domain-containing protein [Paludibacteraceae bacterium]
MNMFGLIISFAMVVIIIVAGIIFSNKHTIVHTLPDTPKQQPKPQKPARPPLTDAEREAIRQADEAFDWKTHNDIVNGTYKGPLPEHVVGGHWTNLYPDLYHTTIAGINFRKGINDLSGVYFDAILVPDTKNKYDKNAIKIVNAEDGRHLGFIPASETQYVRDFVKNTFPYTCRAHVDECEEWDAIKECDTTYLVGEINIKRPSENTNGSPNK